LADPVSLGFSPLPVGSCGDLSSLAKKENKYAAFLLPGAELYLATQLYYLLQPSRPGHTTTIQLGHYHPFPARLLLIIPYSGTY
jgi:hypothetical protein